MGVLRVRLSIERRLIRTVEFLLFSWMHLQASIHPSMLATLFFDARRDLRCKYKEQCELPIDIILRFPVYRRSFNIFGYNRWTFLDPGPLSLFVFTSTGSSRSIRFSAIATNQHSFFIKMYTTLVLTALAATTLASPAPPASWTPPEWNDSCLCSYTAHQTADNIQTFFANYTNEFARALLTPDIVDYTDSVQFLMNNGTNCPQPLGSATFPNRKTLIDAQGAQGSIPWKNLNVFWDCENVFIRWASEQEPFVVRGIAIFRES
jgi:hypothetical protein